MQNFWHQMKIAWHTYFLFREMWQHDKSAHRYIIHVVLHWHCLRKQDGRKQPVLLTFRAYWGTPGSSFLSNSMPDFHCSPSANITSGLPISGMDDNSGNSFRILRYYSANISSGLPISGMDGNSGNSFRILRYLFLNVIILFHWIWFLRVFCWRMYLISYAQGIVACQWLAWLSSMF